MKPIEDSVVTPEPPTTPAPSRPINRYTRFGQAVRRDLAKMTPGLSADEREAMIKAATLR